MICGRCLQECRELFDLCLVVHAQAPKARRSLPIVKVESIMCADCIRDVRSVIATKKKEEP